MCFQKFQLTSPQIRNLMLQNLRNIFNKGKLGSVFVSFGTVAPFESLPHRIQQSILYAVQNLNDYHFVVKVSGGQLTYIERSIDKKWFSDDKKTIDMFANVGNVDLVDWVPQNAVLSKRLQLTKICNGFQRIRI